MNDGPARSARAITPSDTTTFDPTRGLYIGTSGDLRIQMSDNTIVTLIGVAGGGIHPFSVVKVYATSTTATGIVGVY